MDIYKITNVLDGKIYIGKSNNYKHRFNAHKHRALKGSTGCPHLYAAMRKYGVENFICEKIDESFTQEDLCRKEIFWIEKLDARNTCIGYNIARGGEGGATWSWSDLTDEKKAEIRKKLSIASKNAHASRTDEEKAEISKKLSIANSGENNPMFGKNAYAGKTDGELKLISEKKSKSLTGIKRTDEQKKHYSESKMGDKNPMKKLTGDKHPNHGKKCYTSPDESESCYYIPGEEPDGWKQKMCYNLTVNRCGENNGAFGRHWYNNGERNVYEYECPEGYVKGMLKKK